ncbi:MAG: flagellar hook-associated protein FlgL [Nitrosomonadaceae bacterium]
MSGTLGNIYNNVAFALNLHAEAMFKLQEQAATGSRINRASDDPSTSYRVLSLNSQEKSLENYLDNTIEASGTLEISLSILQAMISEITDKKVNLTQVISGTYGSGGRIGLADEINETLEHLVSLANTQHMDQYLYSGSSTGTAPYTVTRVAGEITNVAYQGSSENRNIEIASGVESSAFYVGDTLFRSDSRTTPTFVGDTGAAAGSGTSNIKGEVWLTVTHNGTNYQLSIDGGTTKTTVPLAGDVSNLAVVDASGESILYVDASAVGLTTGTDLVRVSGTYDVFNTLVSIRDMLRNSNGFSETRMTELQNKAIATLEEVRSYLVDKSVSMGSRIGFLENVKDTLENMNFNTEDEATLLQEADIAQIAIDLARREVLYQMSLSVAGRLMSISLLNFI